MSEITDTRSPAEATPGLAAAAAGLRRPAGGALDRAALVPDAVVAGDVRARALEAVRRSAWLRRGRARARRLPRLLALRRRLAPDERRGRSRAAPRRGSRTTLIERAVRRGRRRRAASRSRSGPRTRRDRDVRALRLRPAGHRRRYYHDNGEDALIMWLDPADRSSAWLATLILAIETSCDDTCAAVVDGPRDPLERHLLAGRRARALRRRRPGGRLAPPPRAGQPRRRRGARRGRRRARRRRRDRGHPRPRPDRRAAGGRQHREGAGRGRGGKPLVGVDHLHGHVAANFLEPDPLEPPFLCLIASGGHTLLAGVERARRLRDPRPDARRRRRRGARQGGPAARPRLSGRSRDRAARRPRATRRRSSSRSR